MRDKRLIKKRGYKNSLIKGKSHYPKKMCDVCKKLKRARYIIKIKGKYLCTICKGKRLTSRLQHSASSIKSGAHRLSLEQALKKTYKIYGFLSPKGSMIAVRGFPSILIGHKVKLVLIE